MNTPSPEPRRILLIDAEEAHAGIVQRAFERRGEPFLLTMASTLAEGLQALESRAFDLVISDWRLPDGEGMDLLKRKSKFPILIMTSHGNEQMAVDAVQSERPIRLRNNLVAREIAQEKLRIAERFQLVVDAAPNAMIMLSADGTIVLVNNQTEKLFGYCRSELLGHSVEMLVPERFRSKHREHRTGFFDAPAMQWMGAGRDAAGVRSDGSEVPIEIGMNPVTTSEGRFVLASIVDISERRQMEAALRKAHDDLETRLEERTKDLSSVKEALLAEIERRRQAQQALQESDDAMQAMANSVPQLVWICDPDGLNVYFNRRWTEYTGLTLEESYGTGWNRPFHPADKQPAWNAWSQAVATGGTYCIECRLRRADGQYRWFLTKGVPFSDSTGRVVKWFGTCTDIDDMKCAQEEQRRSLMEKETLLKEVHHRVKNNLQVVCSLLSLQLASAGCDSFSGPLADAHSRVMAMALVHEQIYQSATLADLDFGKYVEILSERLFGAYCVDDSRIRLELSVEEVHLTVDEAVPCGLVLNELLSNSLKHAFNDGRHGVVRVSLRKTEAGHIEVAVADNGIGLPVGFRLEESQSLGLQVVRALVQQLGADLSICRDGGASFAFRWRVALPIGSPA